MGVAEKVELRAVEPGDVDALFALERVEDVRRVSWGECPVSRQLIWEYVSNYTADICRDRQIRLVAVDAKGAFIGAVDVTDYDPVNRRAMLGIALFPECRGRGLGRATMDKAIDFCRRLNLRQLAAMVAIDNEPSMRLFASAGFERAGTLKKWLGDTDVAIMQLTLVR